MAGGYRRRPARDPAKALSASGPASWLDHALERALEAVTFRAGGKAHLGGRLALIYRSVDYYREGPAER